MSKKKEIEINEERRVPNFVMSPYLDSYIEALSYGQDEGVLLGDEGGPNYLQADYFSNYCIAANGTFQDTLTPAEQSTSTVYGGYRRRRGFLLLIAIFMLAILAITALNYLAIVPEYISIFENSEKEYIALDDPILGAVSSWFKVELIEDRVSIFDRDVLSSLNEDTGIVFRIAAYALPVAAVLFLLFVLIILIGAIVGLCKKSIQKGYVEKKAKFGFFSVVLFLLSAIIAVCGAIWAGNGFEKIVEFSTRGDAPLFAGYGLYGIVGLSLLSLICHIFAFKKQK